MTSFAAKLAADTSDLSELGLLSNFNKLEFDGVGKELDAKKGDVKLEMDGSKLVVIHKLAISGTINEITVKVSGDKQYVVSDLHIPLRDAESTFDGDFEPALFAKGNTITGSSQADKLFGYDQADKIKGGDGDDTGKGGKGADNLQGQSGADILNGGQGNDTLDGGEGINTLTGGSGKDAFHFSSQLAPTNVSAITDFTIGSDTIELDNAAFPGIGGDGVLASAKFVLSTDYAGQSDVVAYNKATGSLLYDTTGGTLADAVAFASVTPGLNLSNTDFLVV